jgi:hypothetical protein
MLMITRFEGSGTHHTLKLEGKLLGPWIAELELAYAMVQVSPDGVHLDLLGLNYVDTEGARFLAGLIRAGAFIVSCSGFVAEMLQVEGL